MFSRHEAERGRARTLCRRRVLFAGATIAACVAVPNIAGAGGVSHSAPLPYEVSGVYPHLAMYNEEGECGTGAVVPWAGDLWVVTYGPHCPLGSTDKL